MLDLLIKDLFGEDIDSVNQINPLIDEIPDLPTHISQQARNLVRFFQSEITGSSAIGSAGIQIVRQGIDGAEVLFKDCLIEDNLKERLLQMLELRTQNIYLICTRQLELS